MKLHAKAVPLLFFASGAAADDVYTDFLNDDRDRLDIVNFDVSNKGCFTVVHPKYVMFTSADHADQHFDGPYCLLAYNGSDCHDLVAEEQFQDLRGNYGSESGAYILNAEIVTAATFEWRPWACEHPVDISSLSGAAVSYS